jgi:hypothetical protein
MFDIFRNPPPPPSKKWYQQPAIILSIAAMFILGPVGVIYNGMSEELKQKANNETLLLFMKQTEQKQVEVREQDTKQWEIIQQLLIDRQQANVQTPIQTQKRSLSPKEFMEYKQLSPENKEEYRQATPEIDWSKYTK